MALLPSGLPDEVDDAEDLARFVTQSSHFNTCGVKPVAFLPDRTHDETSVSRHGEQPAERLWKMGAVAAGTRTLYGAAIFNAKTVRQTELVVQSAEPPDFHAAIRKWPVETNDPVSMKSRRLEAALVLASNTKFVRYQLTES